MHTKPPRSAAVRWISSRKALALGLATVLPLLSAVCTARFAVLQTIPFGLYYLSIAIAGVLGGTGPALLAVTFSVLFRNAIVMPWHNALIFEAGDLVRIPTLLADALIVTLLQRRSRRVTKQFEEAHTALQERTTALVDSLHASKCASWVLDLDGDSITHFYEGSYQIFGRPFTELEKAGSVAPFLLPEDRVYLLEIRKRLRTTSEPMVFEYRVPWPNGEIHWIETRAHRVPGERTVWRGVTVDVTERKLAEAALIRSEKLAAMGRIASTVAHEINNPLEAVTNLLYLARTDPTLNETTLDYLKTAEMEVARVGDITRLTLGFVRSNSRRAAVEIAVVAEDVLSIFRHRYQMKNIEIERSIEPGVCVQIAPHELRQILTNLISNAADALNGAEPKIVIQIARGGDEEIATGVFVLEDNGSGIPAAQLPRIFEPFFTTKEDTGTGIGLWVTRELVEKNGGTISVESGKLEGGMRTRFKVEFPLAEEKAG